jgi:hypothetical protein
MKFIEETTEWADGYANHIYYVDDAGTRMVGYIKHGTTALFKFKRPIAYSSKGRKFRKVNIKGESDSVYFGTPTKDLTENRSPATIEVKGSTGETYYVTPVGNKLTCSCKGFMFRRTCRHIETISKEKAYA